MNYNEAAIFFSNLLLVLEPYIRNMKKDQQMKKEWELVRGKLQCSLISALSALHGDERLRCIALAYWLPGFFRIDEILDAALDPAEDGTLNLLSIAKEHNNISWICPECGKRGIPVKNRTELVDGPFNDLRCEVCRSISELKPLTYHEWIQSDEWKTFASEMRRKAGHRCALCYGDGELHVHHRTYERLGKESPEDVIVLCAHCHAKFHDKLPASPDEPRQGVE